MQIRNLFFNWKILPSSSYNFPVIVVGNLSVGGTGKTPHTEYLLNLLKDQYNVAALSRGYGRKTKGFKIADSSDSSLSIGDEPFQIFSKIDKIIVAVDEKRRRGIEKLRNLKNPPEVIILDDAFQHRSVKAGLNILLSDYNNLYVNDLPLPSGRLREPQSASKRADILILTKCPIQLSENEQNKIIQLIQPQTYQKVYFSYISYENFRPLNHLASAIDNPFEYLKDAAIILITAIANPQPMLKELKKYSENIISFKYRDHYYFDEKDLVKIKQRIKQEVNKKIVIICSDKDAVKIKKDTFLGTPMFSLPIKIRFHQNKGHDFEKDIYSFIQTFQDN